jgi:hypothetical protein
MAIETVRDYLEFGCSGRLTFQSKICIREGGADAYRICETDSEYLFVEPINGKSSEHARVHVPRWQHLDDEVLIEMDEQIVRRMVSDFAGLYNSKTLVLEEMEYLLREKYGNPLAARKVLEYVEKRNDKPSTFCHSISETMGRSICQEIFNSSLQQS